MPLPVPFGLPGRELRDALGEVQHAEQRELRQRRPVHPGRRGEDQVRSDQASPLQEAAKSRAGALNPAQPRAVPWHAGRILPVKVEADVGLRPDPGPSVLLGRGELSRHAVMIGGVPRRGDQVGLVERVHARVRVLNPSHQLWLERGGDEDAHGVGLHRSSPSQLSIVNDDYCLIASVGQPWAAYYLLTGGFVLVHDGNAVDNRRYHAAAPLRPPLNQEDGAHGSEATRRWRHRSRTVGELGAPARLGQG